MILTAEAPLDGSKGPKHLALWHSDELILPVGALHVLNKN
jgi:hypothetical protein